MQFHQPHHTLCLEGLGPVGAARGGAAEEEEVRYVDVEAGNDVAEELGILPHCVGAEAVEEEEVGLVFVVAFGDPTVHDGGAVGEGGGFRAETGVEEVVVEVFVS